jgi:hypothetical protein
MVKEKGTLSGMGAGHAAVIVGGGVVTTNVHVYCGRGAELVDGLLSLTVTVIG